MNVRRDRLSASPTASGDVHRRFWDRAGTPVVVCLAFRVAEDS